MKIEQSMQVSMATLTAVNTRHCHTDNISGDTYHPTYSTYRVQLRGEGGEGRSKNQMS